MAGGAVHEQDMTFIRNDRWERNHAPCASGADTRVRRPRHTRFGAHGQAWGPWARASSSSRATWPRRALACGLRGCSVMMRRARARASQY